MVVEYQTLCSLSTEILIKIFHYLSIRDLCSLKTTCKRFNEIIKRWDHIIVKDFATLVTNQRDPRMLQRSEKLSALEKIRVERNWRIGRYRERSLLYQKRKYISWMKLTKDSVWLSRGSNVENYKRNKKSIIEKKPVYNVYGRNLSDIDRFQFKNDFLLCGQRDGSIWLWSRQNEEMLFDCKECHDSEINSVDISFNGNIIVSGSRDNIFKIWQQDKKNLKQIYNKRFPDRVWCVCLSDDKPLVAIGTAGREYSNTIFVCDIENLSELIELPNESNFCSGILDIKWDTPNTFWTCGYESCLRHWDLRSGKCEQELTDPHETVMYCLDCDYYNTVMVGSQINNRVVLWDVRQPRCVQLFFMSVGTGRNSSVYSLAFDATQLFTATEQNLNVLDFSVYDAKVKNYSFCLF